MQQLNVHLLLQNDAPRAISMPRTSEDQGWCYSLGVIDAIHGLWQDPQCSGGCTSIQLSDSAMHCFNATGTLQPPRAHPVPLAFPRLNGGSSCPHKARRRFLGALGKHNVTQQGQPLLSCQKGKKGSPRRHCPLPVDSSPSHCHPPQDFPGIAQRVPSSFSPAQYSPNHNSRFSSLPQRQAECQAFVSRTLLPRAPGYHAMVGENTSLTSVARPKGCR
jgi:hypothetical protein